MDMLLKHLADDAEQGNRAIVVCFSFPPDLCIGIILDIFHSILLSCTCTNEWGPHFKWRVPKFIIILGTRDPQSHRVPNIFMTPVWAQRTRIVHLYVIFKAPPIIAMTLYMKW